MGIRGIIFALMGLAGSGMALMKPYWGLLLLGVLYFFRPDLWGAEDYVTPVKWLTVTVLLGYLAAKQEGSLLGGNGWVLLLLGLYVLSTAMAPMANIASWEKVLLLAKIFVVVVLIDKLCTTPKLLAGFVAAMLVGTLWFVKVAVVGWYQGGFGEERVDSEVGQGGGANYIAWLLAAMIGFVYYKAWRGRSWQRWGAIGLLPLFVMGIIATGSRGGLLCLAAVTGCFLLLMRRLGLVLAGVLGIVLFMHLAPASYLERIGTITTDPTKMDASALTRYQNFRIGLQIIAADPLFGTGLGSFPRAKLRYLPPDYAGESFHVAHNTYVQMGSEAGLLLLGTFTVISLMAVLRLLRKAPEVKDQADAEHLQWVRIGTICALAATWVQCIKGDSAEYDFFWWLYALAFTYHHLCRRIIEKGPEPVGNRVLQPRSEPQLVTEKI